MKHDIKDKDKHILDDYDIVEYFETYPPNKPGYFEMEGDKVKIFSHGYWQVTWYSSKHGYVLEGIGENIQSWIREWCSEKTKYVRKGKQGESNIPM